jgi:hypothetical protein
MWSSYRLSPIPVDAPAFVTLGGPHTPMRAARYAERRTSAFELNTRWAIDTTEVGVNRGPPYSTGDLVVFIGRRGRIWWAPSPVIRVKDTRPGLVELTTLRDRSLEPCEPSHVNEFNGDLADELLSHTAELLPDALKRAVRDVWGLDVWCPRCSGIGNPILYGMPAGDPNELFDEHGHLRPWPAGSYEVGGCALLIDDPGYACPRCATRWGGRAAALERRGMPGRAPTSAPPCSTTLTTIVE